MVTVSNAGSVRRGGTSATKPVLVALLLVAFIVPIHIDLGGLRLSLYRLILLVMLFPAMFTVLGGGAGRVRVMDYLIIAFTLWVALSLTINHGLAAKWQSMGFIAVETMGSYFIARWLIRDLSSFRFFSAWYLAVVLFMLPFAIYQNFYDRAPLIDLTQSFMAVYRTVLQDPRLGYYRAQGAMPHPILFGVFCSAAFALTWYVLGLNKSLFFKLPAAGAVALAVLTSLSSGAWLAVAVQVALMAWRTVFSFMQARWRLLGWLFVGMYVFIEMFSNRSPAQIFARYLTIKSSTAWNRIYIFEHAKDDILRNPIFGIGTKAWTRPRWMVSSIDNFWLVTALRYGLPAFILLALVVFLVFRQAGKNPLTGDLRKVRLGYFFALAGVTVALITVHVWDATYCMYLFLIGSGVWLIDVKEDHMTEVAAPPERRVRYTRFEAGSNDAPAQPSRGSSRQGRRAREGTARTRPEGNG